MSDVALRALLGIAVIAVAVGVGLSARRWSRPVHPAVDVSGLGVAGGIVLFTSTDCTTCRGARERAERHGVVVREVTHELEPGEFRSRGVEAVPLTVVVDAGGEPVAQFAGIPRRRSLARAVAAIRPPVLGGPHATS